MLESFNYPLTLKNTAGRAKIVLFLSVYSSRFWVKKRKRGDGVKSICDTFAMNSTAEEKATFKIFNLFSFLKDQKCKAASLQKLSMEQVEGDS